MDEIKLRDWWRIEAVGESVHESSSKKVIHSFQKAFVG
jgi:hypothetical protein